MAPLVKNTGDRLLSLAICEWKSTTRARQIVIDEDLGIVVDAAIVPG